MRTFGLGNGTRVSIGGGRALTVLPDGSEVPAAPNDDSLPIAIDLGYGLDVDAMTEDHDPLHALLTDWLGMSRSESLAAAAGLPHDATRAWMEEAAVMALQRLIRRAGITTADLLAR